MPPCGVWDENWESHPAPRAMQTRVFYTATQNHRAIWAWAAARVHVWILDPITDRFSDDLHGFCCHWKPCRCLGSWLPPGAMVESEDPAVAEPMLIWEACTATGTQAVAGGLIWLSLRFWCTWGVYWCPFPALPQRTLWTMCWSMEIMLSFSLTCYPWDRRSS